MATLSQAKTLGGIGWILSLLSFAPYVGFVLSIVGLVLVLVAVKYISEVSGDRKLWTNALIALVLGIIGTAIFGVTVAAGFLAFAGFGSVANVAPGNIVGVIAGLVAGLLVVWVLAIVSAIFLRMSFNSISTHLNIKILSTAALLYLIGAILTIILVGFILIFVAEILFIVAFFSIPDTLPGQPAPVAPPAPPPPAPAAPPAQM